MFDRDPSSYYDVNTSIFFFSCAVGVQPPAIVMFMQRAWSLRSPHPEDGDGEEDDGDAVDVDVGVDGDGDINMSLTSISFLQLQLLLEHCPHDGQSGF